MVNLYPVPNDPSKTVLVSANGTAMYRVTTRRKHPFGPPVCRVYRLAPLEAASAPSSQTHTEQNVLVGEVEWKRWSHPVVRSDAFDGTMVEMEVREFLYKVGKSTSPIRCFLGNDDQEYTWKDVKGVGNFLTRRGDNVEVARFTNSTSPDSSFKGLKKWFLEILPANTLDLDMIVLTFTIMEKRRREREIDPEKDTFGDDNMLESGFDGAVAAI